MFNRRYSLSPQQTQQIANYHNAMNSGHSGSRSAQKARENYAKRPQVKRNLYLEIEVQNKSNQELDLVLFDALGAYADQQGYTKPGALSITGISKNYSLVLKKLISGKFLVKNIHLETLAGKEAQFARPISFWDDSMAVDNVSITKTLFPSKGRNSMQYQLNLQELNGVNKTIDSSASLVTKVLAENTYILRFELEEVRFA